MLTFGQVVVHSNPWFLQSCFPARLPQPVPVSGIITLQVQNFIIPFVELNDFPTSPFLQVVGVLNCRTGLSATSKEAVQFAEFVLCFLRVY